MTDVWAKVNRAEQHRADLESVFGEFTQANPYELMLHFDSQSGWNEYRWQVNAPPPFERLALILGDTLYNLRSAFDYLIWQLVIAGGGSPTRLHQFPVAKDDREWANAERRGMIAGIEDPWLAEIKALQPLTRGQQPELHELAVLDYVNNLNKHRFLPVGIMNATRLGVHVDLRSVKGEETEFGHFLDDPIEQDAPAFRFRCASRSQVEMHVDSDLTFRVSFTDGLGHPWDLAPMIEWVKGSLARFEPAFSR